MKRILNVLMLVLFAGILPAQKVVYVSERGDDSWSGAQTLPYESVYKALESVKDVAGPVEIRVAVGKYLISAQKGKKKGELLVPANVTIRGGYIREGTGVKDMLSDNRGNPDGQTIFQGDSTCRIATVKGVLEQVVVAGGRAEGANGGGILVESGGKVVNCIIRSNQASGSTPKVGDLLLKSGDFMDVSQYVYGQADEVVGIVFWVNPKRDAPVGERARAMSIKEFNEPWVAVKNKCKYNEEFLVNLVEGTYCPEVESALSDTDGAANTELLLSNTNAYVTDFPLARACRNYGEGWYLPAIGEIMWILTEWNTVDNSFRMVWDKIQIGSGSDMAVMNKYFGIVNPSIAYASWYEADLLWFKSWPTSSSRPDAVNCWQLSGFYNEAALRTYVIVEDRKGVATVTRPQMAYAVKCF
ncbi:MULTISPECIES: DUF1565 domain-containing protein [Culturomica]|uniref:DUF1565 domain-containing protein n=1 Tax=Culturomica TaxID=1926651 RepID=UPI000E838437|nr:MULTISPECIES: DUF1565 domain-containing protein [Culturomica]HBO27075.1 hypothetical protein [Culturomica sp.]